MSGCGDASGFKLFGTTIQTDNNQPNSSPPPPPPPADDEKSETAPAARSTGQKLPCPRCKSKETKFCYFNNYNVNQPRHFCRSCHRYWTAGGSLRNVPVGAGRRRNRHPPPLSSASYAAVEEVDRWLLGPRDRRPTETAGGDVR